MENATNSQMQRIQSGLDTLVSQKKDLQAKLTYAESAVMALMRQNTELELLLEEAQAELQRKAQVELLEQAETLLNGMQSDPQVATAASARAVPTSTSILGSRGSRKSTGTDWIGGTWLVVPENKSLLGPIESAWQEGKTQEALNLLTLVSKEDDLDPLEEIEVRLLFCAILRSAGLPSKALDHAEEALRMADEGGLVESVGKINFHRGLCFLHMSDWADASWCFVLAASTPGHAQQVEVNWEIAERKKMENSTWMGISKVL